MKRGYNPDLFLIEIIRVAELKLSWTKNNASVNFPVSKLALPGFSRLYRVVATCNHRGSLKGGHWFTKMYTTHGWYELDDLKSKNSITKSPGINDNSVVVILLIAEDKLLSSI